VDEKIVSVVKINREQNNFTCYIGRDWAGLPQSIFHNPYHVGKDGDREEVLLKFAEYWFSPKNWRLRRAAQIMINPLEDVLGCWCKPLSCHGDIIEGYLLWKLGQDIREQQRLFDIGGPPNVI
jgi:Domain of unknown function (DUF4326)